MWLQESRLPKWNTMLQFHHRATSPNPFFALTAGCAKMNNVHVENESACRFVRTSFSRANVISRNISPEFQPLAAFFDEHGSFGMSFAIGGAQRITSVPMVTPITAKGFALPSTN